MCFPPYNTTHYELTCNGWTLTDTTTGYGNCNDGDNSGPGPGGGGGGSAPPPYLQYEQDPIYWPFIDGLNSVEREYFRAHWWRILQAYENKTTAEHKANFYFCDYGQSDNTEANAFKHAYWSALNTQTWGSSIALEIGQNHEQNTDTHNQHAMDLHNNDVGINIGEALPDASFENLAREVLEHLASGAGRKLSNPSDRNSSIIDTNGAMLCRSRLE